VEFPLTIYHLKDRKAHHFTSLDHTRDDFKHDPIDRGSQRIKVIVERDAVADDRGVQDDHEGFHCRTFVVSIVLFYTTIQVMSTKKSAEALFFYTFFLRLTS
jgi:hypothetical protein